mmetsp:Transcript_25702/g.69738  ORF Transcript_25702/g.69738 Transcript_25702/m.69738 type:complete len:213 (-) Transcript_25702:323-961(-)
MPLACTSLCSSSSDAGASVCAPPPNMPSQDAGPQRLPTCCIPSPSSSPCSCSSPCEGWCTRSTSTAPAAAGNRGVAAVSEPPSSDAARRALLLAWYWLQPWICTLACLLGHSIWLAMLSMNTMAKMPSSTVLPPTSCPASCMLLSSASYASGITWMMANAKIAPPEKERVMRCNKLLGLCHAWRYRGDSAPSRPAPKMAGMLMTRKSRVLCW